MLDIGVCPYCHETPSFSLSLFLGKDFAGSPPPKKKETPPRKIVSLLSTFEKVLVLTPSGI